MITLRLSMQPSSLNPRSKNQTAYWPRQPVTDQRIFSLVKNKFLEDYMTIEAHETSSNFRRIPYGMVGGGEGAFIGAVHRIAAR